VIETHLSAENVAAYIDRRLTAEERQRADAHMVRCAECRDELTQAARLVASAPPHRMVKHPRLVALVSLAAAMLVVAVSLSRPGQTPPAASPQREAIDAEPNVIQALTPTAGATITPSTQFVWRREGDARYQLRIVDSTGALVWMTTTNDSSARLPPSVRLQRRSRYFWYVDALRSDGFSISSGPRPFETP